MFANLDQVKRYLENGGTGIKHYAVPGEEEWITAEIARMKEAISEADAAVIFNSRQRDLASAKYRAAEAERLRLIKTRSEKDGEALVLRRQMLEIDEQLSYLSAQMVIIRHAFKTDLSHAERVSKGEEVSELANQQKALNNAKRELSRALQEYLSPPKPNLHHFYADLVERPVADTGNFPELVRNFEAFRALAENAEGSPEALAAADAVRARTADLEAALVAFHESVQDLSAKTGSLPTELVGFYGSLLTYGSASDAALTFLKESDDDDYYRY